MDRPYVDARSQYAVPILEGRAKELAKQWVHEDGNKLPGFRGAYLVGSITTLPKGRVVPVTSDVDIVVVLERTLPQKLGKFIYRDLLLDVSFVEWEQIQSHESILGHSQMAAGYRALLILDDPTGHLTQMQSEVAKHYACRRWVWQRCLHVKSRVLDMFQSLEDPVPFHDHVTAWLFGTSLTTLILTVAALRAPTVRRRYVEIWELLAEHGKLEFYEELLQLLGCSGWSQSQTAKHLAAVASAFDKAKTLPKKRFRFAADISDTARPIAVDGSRALIEQGFHREAVFWLVATYSRCQWIFHSNALSDIKERFEPGYRSMLGDLGIFSFADLQSRSRRVLEFLPRVTEMAETVMAATPEIE